MFSHLNSQIMLPKLSFKLLLLTIQVPRVIPELKVLRETQAHKECKVQLVQLERLGLKASKESKATLEMQANKALKEWKVIQVQLVPKESKDCKDRKEILEPLVTMVKMVLMEPHSIQHLSHQLTNNFQNKVLQSKILQVPQLLSRQKLNWPSNYPPTLWRLIYLSLVPLHWNLMSTIQHKLIPF